MRTIAPVAAGLLAATTFGSETVIDVPQGSGVFPTVGQLNCLEEAGSGRFCAATYECADESGDLWGDLANHDGRRAIGVDSPVARERDCTITVDGKAAVRWFVGFSPDGRGGELVGLTPKHDAEPPVVRRVAQGGSGGSGSFLSWYVERYGIGDIAAEARDVVCGHLVEGTSQRENCLRSDVPAAMGRIRMAMLWENTPFTRCAAELRVNLAARYLAQEGKSEHPLTPLLTLKDRSASVDVIVDRVSPPPHHCIPDTLGSYSLLDQNMCAVMATFAEKPEGTNEPWALPERYAECRQMLEEQWEREGFGELQ